jgi:hypothetical protein
VDEKLKQLVDRLRSDPCPHGVPKSATCGDGKPCPRLCDECALDAIRAAVAAERERCAAVAETVGNTLDPTTADESHDAGRREAAGEIAAAIRGAERESGSPSRSDFG